MSSRCQFKGSSFEKFIYLRRRLSPSLPMRILVLISHNHVIQFIYVTKFYEKNFTGYFCSDFFR